MTWQGSMDTILTHYKQQPTRCTDLESVHKFNNYVKAALIQTFLKPCGQVLDMPCGRGGDLKKYRENKAGFYVGVDIVPERIEEAKKRHRTTKCMFGALFEVADFTKVRWDKIYICRCCKVCMDKFFTNT